MSSQAAFYDLVVEEWRRRDVEMITAPPPSEVVRLFDDLGCRLSADVKEFYAAVGGFVDLDGDGAWYLWPLDEIRRVTGEDSHPFVMFADYCLALHTYCFRYDSPETSSVYISRDQKSLQPEPVAASLAEFLEKLLCTPDEVEAWPI